MYCEIYKHNFEESDKRGFKIAKDYKLILSSFDRDNKIGLLTLIGSNRDWISIEFKKIYMNHIFGLCIVMMMINAFLNVNLVP